MIVIFNLAIQLNFQVKLELKFSGLDKTKLKNVLGVKFNISKVLCVDAFKK